MGNYTVKMKSKEILEEEQDKNEEEEPAMGAVSEFEYRYNMTIKTFPSHEEPGFESDSQQETVWGRKWGCDNDVGQLRMVLMHRPGEEMKILDPSKRLEHLGSYGDAEGQTWYWRGDKIHTMEEQQDQHDALRAAHPSW